MRCVRRKTNKTSECSKTASDWPKDKRQEASPENARPTSIDLLIFVDAIRTTASAHTHTQFNVAELIVGPNFRRSNKNITQSLAHVESSIIDSDRTCSSSTMPLSAIIYLETCRKLCVEPFDRAIPTGESMNLGSIVFASNARPTRSDAMTMTGWRARVATGAASTGETHELIPVRFFFLSLSLLCLAYSTSNRSDRSGNGPFQMRGDRRAQRLSNRLFFPDARIIER